MFGNVGIYYVYLYSKANNMYTNSKLIHSEETKAALTIWYKMGPFKRLEVMNEVKGFKQMARKQRACINYIADNLSKFQ